MRILFDNGIVNYYNTNGVYLDDDGDLIFDLGSYNLVVYHDEVNTSDHLKKIAQALVAGEEYIELGGKIHG